MLGAAQNMTTKQSSIGVEAYKPAQLSLICEKMEPWQDDVAIQILGVTKRESSQVTVLGYCDVPRKGRLLYHTHLGSDKINCAPITWFALARRGSR